jgi:hypothetical protein
MKDWVTVGDLCHEHNHQDWAVSKRKKWIGVIKLSKWKPGRKTITGNPIPNQNWIWKRVMKVQRKPGKKYTGDPSQKALACPKDGLQKQTNKNTMEVPASNSWREKPRNLPLKKKKKKRVYPYINDGVLKIKLR